MLLMLAMASESVDAPTVMLLGALAGDMVQLSPPRLLPAVRWCCQSVGRGLAGMSLRHDAASAPDASPTPYDHLQP